MTSSMVPHPRIDPDRVEPGIVEDTHGAQGTLPTGGPILGGGRPDLHGASPLARGSGLARVPVPDMTSAGHIGELRFTRGTAIRALPRHQLAQGSRTPGEARHPRAKHRSNPTGLRTHRDRKGGVDIGKSVSKRSSRTKVTPRTAARRAKAGGSRSRSGQSRASALKPQSGVRSRAGMFGV